MPVVLVAAAVLAACSSGGSRTTDGSTASTTAAAASARSGPPVWLCRPGADPDPCAAGLSAEVVTATGAEHLLATAVARNPGTDCFYVYPTVSSESGANSDLTVQPAETSAAEEQASRFSSVCRVWAPMYRQVTLSGLFSANLHDLNIAYDSLVSAWDYYLRHLNHGRPIVLLGHSQGAAMLIRLMARHIDGDPGLRRRLVVAILAGANLQVPSGGTVGATFKHIPLCSSLRTPGCAIAYSSFGSPPPPDSLFGRPGTGVSLLSLQSATAGQQVACVDPAAPAGGAGALEPYARTGGAVPWVTYPGLYRAHCESAGGATWLQVDTTRLAGDRRPTVTDSLGPEWGYHLYDVNLALGNLVADVAALETAERR